MTVRNSYEMVPTDSLVPAAYNPNVLSPDDYASLVREIREQGRLLKPIIAREANGRPVIVDGHWSWLAAQDVGLTTVPVELIEADEFEARRQTLIRNRTGKKDNLKLGRVYRDMLAERGFSNRELGEILGISEGSIRNQLLYAEAWDLLREKGERLADEAGQPIEPEGYSFGMAAYTETMITKMPVRVVRALVARLQGLADEDEAEQAPDEAPVEDEHVRLAKLHLTKATEDGRQKVIEWLGVLDKIAEALGQVREAYDKGYAEGFEHGRAQRVEPRAERVTITQPLAEPEPTAKPDHTDWLRATYAGNETLGGRILDLLRDRADIATKKLIMDACGASHKEVERALKKLKLAGFIRRQGYDRYLIADAGRTASAVDPEHVTVTQPLCEVRNDAGQNSYAERGARIKAARQERGLSQRQLAELASVNAAMTCQAERGMVEKSGKPVFTKLEAALGIAMT